MTWGVVTMKHSFVCNIWSHANDPFSEPVSIEGLPEGSSMPFKNIYLTVMLKIIPVEEEEEAAKIRNSKKLEVMSHVRTNDDKEKQKEEKQK